MRIAKSRSAKTEPTARLHAAEATPDLTRQLTSFLKRGVTTEARGEELLADLVDWVWAFPKRRTVPFDDLPMAARMIIVLEGMHRAISNGGMLYVLDWSEGEQFHEALDWFRKIGARRAATYFTRAAALFPRHRVPKAKAGRHRLTGRLLRGGRADPLRDLDDAFRKQVLAEIPPRLQSYLRKNLKTVALDLSSRADTGTGTSARDVLSRGDMIETIADIQRRARASKEGFGYPAVAKVGDVVELTSGRWRCYVQVTHDHPFARTVGLICRKLPRNHAAPLARRALSRLVAGETEHFLNFNVDLTLRDGQARVVGEMPLPAHARVFPTFVYRYGTTRDGRNVYRLWRGSKEHAAEFVGPLLETHRALPVLHYSQSVSALVGHWTPKTDHRAWGE